MKYLYLAIGIIGAIWALGALWWWALFGMTANIGMATIFTTSVFMVVGILLYAIEADKQ